MELEQVRIEAYKLALAYYDFQRQVSKDKGRMMPDVLLGDVFADANKISFFIRFGNDSDSEI
jgi:hypothetical protein